MSSNSLTEITPDGTITWEDETKQQGYISRPGYRGLVYGNLRAIEVIIYDYITCIVVGNPREWIKGDDCKVNVRRTSLDPISRSYPKIRDTAYLKIYEKIKALVPSKLNKAVDEYKGNDNDFIFLAKLGRKRNWKSGCAVCLTDNIMGTTCSCGHTEIAVFRPCGHAMCASPCYYQFIEIKTSQKLKPKTIKIDGNDYTVMGELNIDSSDINFNCYLCNQKVESVFRAEDVCLEGFFKTEAKEIAQQILDTL